MAALFSVLKREKRGALKRDLRKSKKDDTSVLKLGVTMLKSGRSFNLVSVGIKELEPSVQ